MEGSAVSNTRWALASITTAVVVEVGDDALVCEVGPDRVRAQRASAVGPAAVGDRALLVRTGDGAVLALGLVARAPTPSVATPEGARAEVTGGTLAVYDRRGSLLFEHRAADGVTVLHASADDVELVATRSLRLRVAGDGAPSITLGREVLSVHAPRTALTGASASVRVDDARLEATLVTTVADRARAVVGALETRAVSLVTRARSMMYEVEELAQTRAGTVRTVAREGFHVRGRRATIKVDDDVKLKGQKIYLA